MELGNSGWKKKESEERMYDAKNWRVKRQQWIMRSSKDEEVHDDKAREDNGNMGRSEIQRMGGKMGR